MTEKSPPKASRKPSGKRQITPPKPEFGSRVGNGAEVLPAVDGRMLAARRYREICAALIADMGGEPSEAQTIIIRRAASLAMWCEEQEVEMANGRDFDIAAFTTATNALRRLLADIGLERKAKDVTPTIGDYAWRLDHPEGSE